MGRFVRLDHVGIVGTNLSYLESTYRRLGFAVTQAQPLVRPDPSTGKAIPLGQSSQHMVFRTGYVELTAITDHSAGNHLEPYIRKYHGVHIIALAVADAGAAYDALRDEGIDAKKPMPLTRDVLYGAGGVAGFRWFPIAEHQTPEAYVCATQHLTPEVVYQESVQSHGNGAVALSSVMIGVVSIDEARPRFERMFGTTSRLAGGSCVFDIGTQQVVLMNPDEAQSSFPGSRLSTWPRVIGFTITVESIDAVETMLRDHNIRLREGPRGAWVHPDDTAGCIVAFRGP